MAAVFRIALLALAAAALLGVITLLVAPALASSNRHTPTAQAAPTSQTVTTSEAAPSRPVRGWVAPTGQHTAFAPGELGKPDQQLPIQLEVIDDRVVDGQWQQTIRVTILPDATMPYVSLALYGDDQHTEELLDLAREQYPDLEGPQSLFVGMTFDVPVDPQSTFVILASQQGSDGTKTRTYFNGVVETFYPESSPLRRQVRAPVTDWLASFFVPGRHGEVVDVPPAHRLVEYVIGSESSIQPVLMDIYGTDSYTALRDFLRQADWIDDQSLYPGEHVQVVVNTEARYEDPQPARGLWVLDDPIAQGLYNTILQQRQRTGIQLAEVGPTSYRFLVGVYDRETTAADVAALLYGTTERSAEVLALAGRRSTNSEGQSTQGQLNDRVFGRPFEVRVDLAEELFVFERYPAAGDIVNDVLLLNGTRLIETNALQDNAAGIQRVIRYPSGNVSFQYRPNGLTMTLADTALFAYQIFVDAPISVDVTDRRVNAYLAELRQARLDRLPAFLWEWDPRMPRQGAHEPLQLGWASNSRGSVLLIMLGPEEPRALSLADRIDQMPSFLRVLLLGALVSIIAAALIVFGLQRSQRRPTWKLH